jgi:hypothetical protein
MFDLTFYQPVDSQVILSIANASNNKTMAQRLPRVRRRGWSVRCAPAHSSFAAGLLGAATEREGPPRHGIYRCLRF